MSKSIAVKTTYLTHKLEKSLALKLTNLQFDFQEGVAGSIFAAHILVYKTKNVYFFKMYK